MDDLTTDQLGELLKREMDGGGLTLAQAVAAHGWDYQRVYYRLTRGGWSVVTTQTSRLERLAVAT